MPKKKMLKSLKKIAKAINFKHYAQSSVVNTQSQQEKKYTFDLKYVIKRFNANFENVKPLVTIVNEKTDHKEPVIVFPGFEGHINTVENLIFNLNRTVHCFQYPLENCKNSIAETAISIIQLIKSHKLDVGRMNIIGHSYGGIVAIETIRYLEQEGKNIRLCLLDSSPYATKVMITRSFGHIQEIDDFENDLLINIANCAGYHHSAYLNELLADHTNWHEKMNIVLPLVAEKTQYNAENLKLIANGLSNVLQAMYYYNENSIRLTSETTLIRSSIKVLPFPEDFKISKVCKNPVKEFHTEGHHLNMLKFPRTAELINEAFRESV